MKKIKRNLKFLACTSLLLCGLCSFTSVKAFADEGRVVEATLASNSYLDGSDFNRYYHLTPGTASLQVTEFEGDSSNVDVFLRKERVGPDQDISEVRINGTGWYHLTGIRENSYKYYLYLMSHGRNSIKLKGYMHDHS